jgi:hypothetical protein
MKSKNLTFISWWHDSQLKHELHWSTTTWGYHGVSKLWKPALSPFFHIFPGSFGIGMTTLGAQIKTVAQLVCPLCQAGKLPFWGV